jgi:hypothetical protein
MSDNPIVAEARGELAACQPRNRPEECALEAIGVVINPPGSVAPSADSLAKLIEAPPPEAFVTTETIRYAKVWTTLRSALRCLGVEVASEHGKTVAICVIKAALSSGDGLREWCEEATARY